jgi:site-specific recombinase XerD
MPDNGSGTTTAIAVVEPASGSTLVPAMVAAASERAARRFIDFFTANIRNPNTRAAYGVAVRSLFAWLDRHGIRELGAIRAHHVSAYIETRTRAYRAPTVKQHLAALRMLFDWLIVGQVVEQNPAAAVRGPKHVVKKGKTPVLDGEEVKKLSTASMCRRSSGCAIGR